MIFIFKILYSDVSKNFHLQDWQSGRGSTYVLSKLQALNSSHCGSHFLFRKTRVWCDQFKKGSYLYLDGMMCFYFVYIKLCISHIGLMKYLLSLGYLVS